MSEVGLSPEEDAPKDALSLLGFGLLMGVVHVISGPDHLCVLAALSVNGSWSAFWLGTRWAIGHSTGLFMVAVVFLILKHNVDLETLEMIGLLPVGIMMVCLGFVVIVRSFVRRRQQLMSEDIQLQIHLQDPASVLNFDWEAPQLPEEEDEYEDVIGLYEDQEGDALTLIGSSSLKSDTPLKRNRSHKHRYARTPGSDIEFVDVRRSSLPRSALHGAMEDQSPPPAPFRLPILRTLYRCISGCDVTNSVVKQRILAFCVGIVAGVAGPGGVLGVLPAVVVDQLWLSLLYLFSFFLTSTLTMVVLEAKRLVIAP